MVIGYGKRIIPDEGNGSRRMTKASLKESATHDFMRCHECCQCLVEDHVILSYTNKARITNRFVDGKRKAARVVSREEENEKRSHTPQCTSWMTSRLLIAPSLP